MSKKSCPISGWKSLYKNGKKDFLDPHLYEKALNITRQSFFDLQYALYVQIIHDIYVIFVFICSIGSTGGSVVSSFLTLNYYLGTHSSNPYTACPLYWTQYNEHPVQVLLFHPRASIPQGYILFRSSPHHRHSFFSCKYRRDQAKFIEFLAL